MMRLVMLAVGLCAAALLFPQHVESVIAMVAGQNQAGESPAEQSAPQPTRSAGPLVNAPRAVGGTVILTAASNGHFYTEAMINGRPLKVVVDTGATSVAIPYEDARRLGIMLSPSDFTVPVHTANGEGRAASVSLREVRVGSIRVSNVQAMVLRKGQLGITLLGMSFLGRLSQASISSGELMMRP